MSRVAATLSGLSVLAEGSSVFTSVSVSFDLFTGVRRIVVDDFFWLSAASEIYRNHLQRNLSD